VCAIRSKPDGGSEMISQLLFGEQVSILDKYKGNWLLVACAFDGFEGWMDSKQIDILTSDIPYAGDRYICYDIAEAIFCDGDSTYITLGAELPIFDGMTAKINERKYRFSGQVIMPTGIEANFINIEKLSRKLMNAPHLRGGRSPFGIDCSGFTQLIFKCLGIALHRSAQEQALQGDTIDFISQIQAGDLAFFSRDSDKITHVGIIMDSAKIIHAYGRVRIDTIDHYGIFNDEIQEYTHRLKIVKRLLPTRTIA
jgi:gamma-D-glutamyl-L-lysine dipeptidyl-peptidase